MGQAPSGSETLVRAAAASLLPRLDQVGAELTEAIRHEIPELALDGVLLYRSVTDSLRSALRALAEGAVLRHDGLEPSTVEYVRRLAERGVPASTVLRVYRLGQALGQDRMAEELAALDADPALIVATAKAMSAQTFSFVDRVTEQVVAVHERARAQWSRTPRRPHLEVIDALLSGSADAPRRLAALVRPERTMVAGVVWTDGDGPPSIPMPAEGVMVPVDRATTWLWLPAARPGSASVPETPGAWMAFGEPATGSEGHVASHFQARAAQQLVSSLEPSARPMSVHASDIRLPLLLARDPAAARTWIQRTLGPLAADDEKHRRVRETLRVYLGERGSYSATAARLSVHRNTVLNRVRSAERILGRPVTEGRVELEAALLAARWIGPQTPRLVVADGGTTRRR